MKRLFRLSDSRPDPKRDVDDEIRFHLEMRAREFIENGLAPDEARRAAADSFGDVTTIRERCREERIQRTRERARRDGLRMLSRDIAFAMRTLRRNRYFTIAAIFTIALGIGATTTVFSVVDGVLLRPLPYPESEQLVWLAFTAPGLGYDEMPYSQGAYAYVRDSQRSLQDISLFSEEEFNLTGEGEPLRVMGERVTPGFFDLMGVPLAIGRTFTSRDGAPGAEPVAILSHALWIDRFGGNPAIVGGTVTIDGVAHRVTGVTARGFAFPSERDRIWVPLIIDPSATSAGNFSFPSVGRLKSGATIASARADLERLAVHIGDVVPDLTPAVVEKAGFAPVVTPLKERIVGDVRRPLWIVLGTGAFVLLIACANVANLFLVRADGRARELALRSALGASRVDMITLMLGESVLIAAIGGALGFGLAVGGTKGLLALAEATIPRAREIGTNGHVLLFAIAVSMLSGMLFASASALHVRDAKMARVLGESGRTATPGRARGRTRNALVVLQVAMALVLMIGAGLMFRTFRAIRAVDPGFRIEHVLTFDVTLSPADYPASHAAAELWRTLVERLEALPGVKSAAVTNSLPLGSGVANGTVLIEGHPVPEGVVPVAERKYVSPAYFETLGIPLLEGRALNERDASDGVRAAVVNRSFARHWWPDGSALGGRIRESSSDPWYQVVGVVGDVRFKSLQETAGDAVYFPVLAGSANSPRVPRHVAVAIRTEGDPAMSTAAVRGEVRALDAGLPIANLGTMQSVLDASMARTSFVLTLLGIAAAVSLLLGMVGIYGVVACAVSQRRREIGVRMALGASTRDVRRMVVRQGIVLAVIGIACGSVAALALSRLLGTLLYGVGASDPLTYGAITAALLGVAILASYFPARIASGIDPMECVRSE